MRRVCRAATILSLGIALWTGVASAQHDAVTVEAVLAREVVDRMPVDTGIAFSPDVERVFLWTRVTGAAGQKISHVWIHGSDETVVDLEVGGSPWRTWSSRTIDPAWTGEWKVEVRNQAGEVVDAVSFTVG